MTSVPIDAVRAQLRDAGHQVSIALGWVLFALGWTVAKALRAIGGALAWLLYGVGLIAGRTYRSVLFTYGWTSAAVILGWREGMKPIGGQRGNS